MIGRYPQNESNCRFKFDFENVYWNSRLSMEHKRVVESLESNAEVWDLFAGVGYEEYLPCRSIMHMLISLQRSEIIES